MPDDQELSSGESYRVARAFYRLQIYTNLFAEGQEDPDLFAWYKGNREETAGKAKEDIPSPTRDQMFVLFNQHQPWINEQLACVYNFPETRITEGEFSNPSSSQIYVPYKSF